jgi:hypothetical protein
MLRLVSLENSSGECQVRANPALEPTAASALRLLAAHASLRFSPAAQRER